MEKEIPTQFYIGLKKYKKTGLLRSFKVSAELEDVVGHKKKADPEVQEDKPVEQEGDTSFQKLFSEMVDTLESFRSLGPLAGGLIPLLMSTLAIRKLTPFLETEATFLESRDDGGDDSDKYDVYTAPIDKIAKYQRVYQQISQNDIGLKQLPRMVVVGLIADYDAFLAKLIRIGIFSKPEIINQSDKQFKISDLIRFRTIEEAKAFVVEREIDSILREDHREQLISIGKLFGLKIDTKESSVLGFLEACERRNLFTHVGGVVTDRYLQKCKEFGVDLEDKKLGDKLDVSSSYYTSIISDVYEVSVRLCQAVWRKILPNDAVEADSALIALAYNLILNRDYKLAQRILRYGCKEIKHASDSGRRMMVINFANAIKLDGDMSEASKVLDKEDWTAAALSYQISVAAVRDNVDEVVRLMPLAVSAHNLNANEFREWPVFETVREKPEFQTKFQELFGESITKVKLENEEGDLISDTEESDVDK